ncbi:hypothetical protein BXT86_04605 [candidate division WOR-3 bacterium 4484_100]|uniref:DUF1015 domain-containing protein n=1 Tax=candidate division WOR-3 bacterium 4484_100 TaxID=1936077 RepID=A0A1V4QEY9_UNCW3|nr:MAG: hypothetical protein BXT86_04605 [candidate division WOR-3 bacterium 4484_100]
MPVIKPFKGIRYNPEKIEELGDVVCLPYDQITDEMDIFYKTKSPYNFVRLVLTKYTNGHNRRKEYNEARKYIEQWQRNKIFIQEEEPAIYPYIQKFSVLGNEYTRKAFICLIKLEELGKNILPHERTLSKPKEDRLNLLRITKKDLEPVFLLYIDEKNYINKLLEKYYQEEPLIDIKDDDQVEHKLWCATDPKIQDKIAKRLEDSIFVIADGHHRYETALNYLRELRVKDPEHPACYKLVALVNIEDKGLVILPTHRLIKKVEDFNLGTFLKKTSEYFDIKKTDRKNIAQQLAEARVHTFGFYSQETAYILKLKSLDTMKQLLPERSESYQNLDVAILHTVMIEKILGIKPEQTEELIRYERGIEDTMRQVDSGKFQFCFLMNPTRPTQVRDVAQNRERMPQKSTDFYPKLISGLVFYNLE